MSGPWWEPIPDRESSDSLFTLTRHCHPQAPR